MASIDKMIDSDISNKIANMSFVCALLVVLIHCPKVMSEGGVAFMHNCFPGAFMSMANAFFFTVSGFFLAAHFAEKGWWEKELAKRVHSLIVPYFLLNALWFFVQVIYQWPNVRYPVDASTFHWVGVLRAFGLYGSTNPVNGPLWYLRTLILFVVTAPLVVAPFTRKKAVGYCACLLLFLLNCFDAWKLVLPEAVFWVYRPQWLAFFLWGATMRIHGIPQTRKCLSLSSLIMGFLLSLHAPQEVLDTQSIPFYNAARWLSRPLLIIGVFSIVGSHKWPKILVGNSFAIYVLHWPLIIAAYIICGKTNTFHAIFGSVFNSIAYFLTVIGLTIAVAQAIRRNHLLSRLLLGGR